MSEFGLRSYGEDPVDEKLPEHLRAIYTGDWISLIFRMRIPTNCYGVAIALARFASTDGSNVFPGAQKVADMAKMDEKTARGHIKALVELGMLVLKKRGGGRAGNPSVYRLTRPGDITTLPLWLDPEMDRIEAGAEFVPVEPDVVSPYLRASAPAETEHRAAAPGESPFDDTEKQRAPLPGETAEHRASAPAEMPVDNSGAAETPGDRAGNTGRSAPKHRAGGTEDLTTTRPTTNLLGSPQVDTSLGWRDRGPAPAAVAALVGPPRAEPWISPKPPAVGEPGPAAAEVPSGRRAYAEPDPPPTEQPEPPPAAAAEPPRVVRATAALAPTPAIAAIFALLDAQPNGGEWWTAAARAELRREGITRPTRLDLAVRAAAILGRHTPTSETRSA